MKSHSFLTTVIAAIILSSGLITTAVADNATATSSNIPSKSLPTKKKDVHVLFTQTASSATITPQQQKGWYTLTLNNVNPDVLWFSDRPNRLSGDIAMTEFVNYWQDKRNNENFVKDHPNADLIGTTGSTKVRGVFMLSKPNYDPQQQTLTYSVYHIGGAGNFNDSITSLQQIAIFIDHSWCPFPHC